MIFQENYEKFINICKQMINNQDQKAKNNVASVFVLIVLLLKARQSDDYQKLSVLMKITGLLFSIMLLKRYLAIQVRR